MSGLEQLFVDIVGNDPVVQGLAGGVVIASLNMVGALAILLLRNPSDRLLDTALGFAAGVMLAASFTSLILPGIEQYGSVFSVMVGVALGALFLDRADTWVPHVYRFVTGRIRENGKPKERGEEHPHAPRVPTEQGLFQASVAAREGHRLEPATAAEPEVSGGGAVALPRAEVGAGAAGGFAILANRRVASLVLFILAITLHNMPEGLAVGVGFGSGNLGNAIALMLAIGIQNIPEGLAVSVAARNAGLGSRFYAVFTGIRAGVVEIPLAVFGAALVTVAEPVLPYAMGFAAGAMIYVVAHEVIPETHAKGNKRTATLGVILGLIVMVSLDVALA
ncbi:MAG TPA: ZIP family metal transporter [Thermoleophilaceae bacterium]|nr:ZIP family metal transporter [Thermoleophilaceae bacterium]